jgi:serine/threonine protein kinase
MASFAQLTPAEIIKSQQEIIKNIHDITVSQIPAEVTQIAELPPQTGPAIPTGAGTSGYRSIYNGKPVVVKQINVLSKIRNNILGKKQLPPKIIEESKIYIITGLLNEISNYYEVSQIPGHFFCRFIGYKIEYKTSDSVDGYRFIVSIVMEDCGTEDLHSYFERILNNVKSGNIALKQSYRLLTWTIVQALLALQKLHSDGWVHLDLKPENIFFNNNSKIVLLGDSGSVTKIGASTMVLGPVGTPAYIAPELLYTFFGIKNNDMLKRADIYSLFMSFKFFTNNYNKVFNINLKEDAEIKDILGEGEWFNRIFDKNPQNRPNVDELIARIRIVNPAYLESYDVFKRNILEPEHAKAEQEAATRMQQLKAIRMQASIIKQQEEDTRKQASIIKQQEEDTRKQASIIKQQEEDTRKQHESSLGKRRDPFSNTNSKRLAIFLEEGGGARGRTKTHRSSKKGHKKRGTQKTNRLRRR